MKDFKTTVKNKANIIMGKARVAAGNLIGDEELTLKGKLQVAKGAIGEKTGFDPNIVAVVVIGAIMFLILATLTRGRRR